MITNSHDKSVIVPFQLSSAPDCSLQSVISTDPRGKVRPASKVERDCPRFAVIGELSLRRFGLLSLFRGQMRGSVALFRNATEVLEAPSGERVFSCILIDIDGRRLADAVPAEELQRIRKSFSATPIVVLSDRDDHAEVLAAFRSGLSGFIPANIEPDVAKEAVRLVLAGGTYFPAGAVIAACHKPDAVDGQDQEPGHCWSPRQLAVLRLVVQARTNKEIARALKMEESTVKVHVWHIMKKLDAANRTEAALRARELGVAGDQQEVPSGRPSTAA